MASFTVDLKKAINFILVVGTCSFNSLHIYFFLCLYLGINHFHFIFKLHNLSNFKNRKFSGF